MNLNIPSKAHYLILSMFQTYEILFNLSSITAIVLISFIKTFFIIIGKS